MAHEHTRLVRGDQVVHRRRIVTGRRDHDLVDLLVADDLAEIRARSQDRETIRPHVAVFRHETGDLVLDLDRPEEVARGAP